MNPVKSTRNIDTLSSRQVMKIKKPSFENEYETIVRKSMSTADDILRMKDPRSDYQVRKLT